MGGVEVIGLGKGVLLWHLTTLICQRGSDFALTPETRYTFLKDMCPYLVCIGWNLFASICRRFGLRINVNNPDLMALA
jgi:hypothetical protein